MESISRCRYGTQWLGTLLGLVIIAGMSTTGLAAIININSGDSINTAVNAANPGDELVIVSGTTFAEDVVLNKQLTLRSSLNPLPVVKSLDITAAGVAVQGIKIQNSAGHGVTFAVDAAGATFTGCDISDNTGNGININAAAITLVCNGCAIFNNAGGYGIMLDAGAAPRQGPNVTLNSCTLGGNLRSVNFTGNSSVDGHNADPVLTVNGCTFYGKLNDTSSNSRMINITDIDRLTVTITNSFFSEIQGGIANNNFGCIYIICRGGDHNILIDNVDTYGTKECANVIGANATNNINCTIKNSRFLYYNTRWQMRQYKGTLFTEDCVFYNSSTANEIIGLRGKHNLSASPQANMFMTRLTMFGGRDIMIRETRKDSVFNFADCHIYACQRPFRLRDMTATDQGCTLLVHDSLVENATPFGDPMAFFYTNTGTINESTVEFKDNVINTIGRIAYLDANAGNAKLTFDHNLINNTGGLNPLIAANAGRTFTNLRVGLRNNTLINNGNSLVDSPAACPMVMDASTNIIYGWNGNLFNNAGSGTFTENYNVFIPTGAGQVLGITGGANSVTTTNADAVFCSLDPGNQNDYLRIKKDGPAYHIRGSQNAGYYGTCSEPPSDVMNWNLY